MNEEMLFTVCNIPRLLDKMLKDIRDQASENMTKENLDGYDYACGVAITAINEIVHSATLDSSVLVHCDEINDKHDTEEFDLQGLLQLFNYRIVTQCVTREEN